MENNSTEVRTMMTAESARVEIARRQIPIYKLAALVDVHPSRLGLMLGERIPLPHAVAERVREALDGWGQRRGGS